MELWLWCMSCNFSAPINIPNKLVPNKSSEDIYLPFLVNEFISQELIPFDIYKFSMIKSFSNIYRELNYEQYIHSLGETGNKISCFYCGVSFQSLENWHYIRSLNDPSLMNALPEIGIKYDLWDFNPFGGDADAGNFE